MEDPEFERRLDIFLVHRFIQDAVIEGLSAGGAEEALAGWRAELDPLEPIPTPLTFKPTDEATTGPTQGPRPAPRGSGSAEDASRRPLKLFVSYSHADSRMRRRLDDHLASLSDEGLIRIWHDREIEAGADWEGEINREIAQADLILLLVSASFLASRYCKRELVRALEQRSKGKAVPIPILLRPCDWSSVFNTPDYKAQALPRDNRAIAGGRWPNQDTAYAELARELRKRVEGILQRAAG